MKFILGLSVFLYIFPIFANPNSQNSKKSTRVTLLESQSILEREIAKKIIESINGQIMKGGYVGIYYNDNLELEINEIYQKNTTIPIASISKPFTAFAVLKLIDDGVLKLNDSISRYIPELYEYRDMIGGKEITVRDLLQHTSGIPYEGNKVMVKIQIGEREFNIPNQTSEAGKKFIYSNHNYRLLAKVVESVIGQTLSDYVKEKIFEPLDIIDYNLKSYDGASGLAISPEGIYKFCKLILNKGKFENTQIISWKKLKYFFKVPKIGKTNNHYYGLGWRIELSKNGKKIKMLGHDGKGDYTHSVLKIFPDKDAIMMLFTLQSRTNKGKFDATNKVLEKNIEKYMEQYEKLQKEPPPILKKTTTIKT